MAIHTGLIPAMEINNIHNIIAITNFITVAKKILKSKVDSSLEYVHPTSLCNQSPPQQRWQE